jgi:hypothetical protein
MSEAYRIRSDSTWDGARSEYLDGATAEEVCRRYDLGLSAFRARARREGWRRADVTDPAPIDDDAPSPFDDLTPVELAEVCLRRVARAIDLNRSADALRWMRLHAALRATPAPTQAEPAPAEAPSPEPDVHKVHSKFSEAANPSPNPQVPTNRAERRRLAATIRRLSG